MPTLTVLQGPEKGRVFRVEREPMTIGRASEAAPLSDSAVSRRHCKLTYDSGAYLLEDLRSSNGTYVNGRRVTKPVRLKAGDYIRVGGTLLAWSGEPREARGRGAAADLVDLDARNELDAALVSSVASNDDSVILASPAAADAVRAWRVMAQLAEAIGAASSPEVLLDRVMDIIFDEVPVSRGFILLRDTAAGQLKPVVVRERGVSEKLDRIVASRSMIDQVVQKREGVLFTNASADENSGRGRSKSMQAYGLRSVICAPIVARDEVLGVIHIDAPMAEHIYSEEQLRLVTAIGRMSGVAIEDARLVAQRMEMARLAATGEAVASLSHAIKNILHGLRAGADVVEMALGRQNLGMVDQGWQIVQRNVEKIYNLALNMLAFSKTREPRIEQTSLNRLVGEVVQLIQRRAEDKGALLVEDYEEPFPPVPVDSDGMQHAILNILTNAIDAVPKTTGVINVRTRYDPVAGEARVVIGDNGPGIPPEILAHAYEPFQSTKGQGGTGLGLAVTKKVVNEQRGRMDIRCEAGQGTIVTICLPAEPAPIDSAATIAPATKPAGPDERTTVG